MDINEIQVGFIYRLTGDILNGINQDGTPRLTKEDVVRKVTRISSTLITCECGRKFVINNNLKIEKAKYQL